MSEAHRESGEWVFVDVGFSNASKSCGLLVHDGAPIELTFADLQQRLVHLASASTVPRNLLLETPLCGLQCAWESGWPLD